MAPSTNRRSSNSLSLHSPMSKSSRPTSYSMSRKSLSSRSMSMSSKKNKKKSKSTKKKKKKKIIIEDPKVIRDLYYAAQTNNLQIIKNIFTDVNGEYTNKYDFQQTGTQQCIVIAASKGHTDLLQYIIEYAASTIYSSNSNNSNTHTINTQLLQSTSSSTTGVHDLSNSSLHNNNNNTSSIENQSIKSYIHNLLDGLPLQRASYYGQLESCQLLVSLGANINAVSTFYGITSLHYSCQQGHLKVTKFLIANNASIDITNHAEHNGIYNGWSALHYACNGGHLLVIQALVENGATVDILNANQETPCSIAAECGYWQCVEYLIEKGANIHVKRRGLTLLQWAVYRASPEAVQFLVSRGATVELNVTTEWMYENRTLYDVMRYEWSESIYEEIDLAIYRGTEIIENRRKRDDCIRRIQWKDKKQQGNSISSDEHSIYDITNTMSMTGASKNTSMNNRKELVASIKAKNAVLKSVIHKFPSNVTDLIIAYDQ